MSNLMDSLFNGKKKKVYKNPKGNNSTRVPVKYKEIEEKIKRLREEKNAKNNSNLSSS